jgi:hypothetical protein
MTHPLVEVIDAERRKDGARGLRRLVPLAVLSGVLAFVGITAPAATTTTLNDPATVRKVERLEQANAKQAHELKELKSLLMVCSTDHARPECVNVPKGSTVLPVLQRLNAASDDDDNDDSVDDTRTVVVTPPATSAPSKTPPTVKPTTPPKERERPNHRTTARHDGTSSANSQRRNRHGD